MANLPVVFVSNGAAVMMLIILFYSSQRIMKHRFMDEKLFIFMIFSTVFQCVVETATYCIDGVVFTNSRIIALVLNSLLFINNIVFAYVWTLYADYKLFGDTGRLKKKYPLLAVPAVLVTVASIVNLFTPVFFSVDAGNVYHRTNLYIIPYFFTYLYLLFGVAMVYRFRNKVGRYLFLPAILFMVPILIASIIQFFCYGFSLVWLGVAIALCSLYINIQNEAIYIDSLSGVFTRQYMNRYIETEYEKVSFKKLGGIMIDVDQFKSINDQFGHLVGDDAIVSVGKILHTDPDPTEFVARYAGDEFVVLKRVESEEELSALIGRIKKQTERFNQTENKPYKLSFSYGISVLEPVDTIDTFLKKMDMSMYENKNRKKEK